MEITRKQKEEIIKRAKKDIVNGRFHFLCPALGDAIEIVTGTEIDSWFKDIKKIFPRFSQKTAFKYFGAREHFICWWSGQEIKLRIKFLNYLLDGKLPKRNKK
jgi:hypothetical protein